MTILAFDPGKTGAIAVMTERHPYLSDVLDIPVEMVRTRSFVSAPQLAALLVHIRGFYGPVTMAFVEDVHAMPGQGVSSMFSFGRGLGVIDGVLAGLGIPVTRITPQAWQKVMQARGDGAELQRARELFPHLIGSFARKKDSGRADAALIGMAGIRLHLAKRPSRSSPV